MKIECWQMMTPREPMVLGTREFDEDKLEAAEVLVAVEGCGVCHTDLGFLYEGVRTRSPLPLTLGHEIAGRIVATGADAKQMLGKAVVVPAVLPCGECDACKSGRGGICPTQLFPGNDDHGGFASHVKVPARGLCVVDEAALKASSLELADLSVIADAVSTPYQALINADLKAGDLAIFVGAGGVGGFGVQLAAALGATVVALDINPERLEALKEHGASLTLNAADDPRALKKTLRAWAKEQGLPAVGWKVFETSGNAKGQELAFSLLGPGGHLGVVGFTRDKVNVRLSNLMAFDATARGTWGCLPEHYGAIVDLVLAGKVVLKPFIEHFKMSELNEVFEGLHNHKLGLRPVMLPDFDS